MIFVVMNNRSHGTIADLQAANFGASFGCEFVGPDGDPYSPDFAALRPGLRRRRVHRRKARISSASRCARRWRPGGRR